MGLRDFLRGLSSFVRGLIWLKGRPRLLALLSVPTIFSVALFFGSLGLFYSYGSQWAESLLFAPFDFGGSTLGVWFGAALYFLAKILVYAGLVTLSAVSCLVILNIIASPIYEYVSLEVERDRAKSLNLPLPPNLSFKENLHVVWVEVKKAVLILTLSIIFILIPGFNLLASLGAAFLVGWGFYDYPLARRNYTLKQRLSFALKDFVAVLGFGLWLIIPFVQVILMPLAVAGGSLLCLESKAFALGEAKRRSDLV